MTIRIESRRRALLGVAVTLAGTLTALVAVPMPAMASGTTTTVDFNLSCTLGSFGTYTYPGTMTAKFPDSEPSGTQYSGKNLSGTYSFGAGWSSGFYGQGFRSVSGTITALNFDQYENGTLIAEAIDGPFAIPSTPIVNDGTTTIDFPAAADGATIGPFTAGQSGTTDKIKLGDEPSHIFASVTLLLGYLGGTVTVNGTCAVPSSLSGPIGVVSVT